MVHKKGLKKVDASCLEPQNDVVSLSELSEASLLHNIRIRFQQKMIYVSQKITKKQIIIVANSHLIFFAFLKNRLTLAAFYFQ